MTVLSRGARARRGGRRPGWLLLTILLVLAIGASSALVFTNRVELLKLAVILALWAAVVAAFVSVIYRRQSDADQAKVRDLKLVYDLQLDREISARREYELTVETHLRREIASELRAQSADEVAALRAELAALRTNLEILFDADLAHRPALETERPSAEWIRSSQPVRSDRVVSSRIADVGEVSHDEASRTVESPIIDVPEEPLVPPVPEPAPEPAPETPAEPRRRRRRAEDVPSEYRGAHRTPSADTEWFPPIPAGGPPPTRSGGFAPMAPGGLGPTRPDVPQPGPEQPRRRRRRAEPEQAAPPPIPPRPGPERARPEVSRPVPVPPQAPQPPQSSQPEPAWQPMNTWIPSPPAPEQAPEAAVAGPDAVGVPDVLAGPRGRHSAAPVQPPESVWAPQPEPAPNPEPEPERRGRHSASDGPASTDFPPVEPPARHRSPEPEPEPESERPPRGGQPASELLARFQVETGGGGRRRRREE